MHPQPRDVSGRLSALQLCIVALMFGLSVLSYFDRTIMSIAGPSIMREFGVSETAMGVVYSSFTLGYALFMIPGGWLADRFGPRRVLAAMAMGSAFFTAATALAGYRPVRALFGVVPILIAMRLGFGFATAPLYPTCGRMNANWIPSLKRARVQGLVNAGAGLGGAVAPVLFAALIATIGWRMSFAIAASITATVGIAWWLIARDNPALSTPEISGAATDAQRGGTRAPWRLLLTDTNLILLTFGYLTVGYFQYIFFYWIYYYLGTIRKLSSSESAVYTTVLFLVFGAMMSCGGWVSDRLRLSWGRKTGLKIAGAGGLALGAALLYAAVNTSGVTAAVTLMALALGFSAVSDVAFWTGTIDIAGEHVGAACGILNAGGNVGGLIAPITTPIIAAALGWSSALYFGCAMAFIGFLIWLRIDSTRSIERPASMQVQAAPSRAV